MSRSFRPVSLVVRGAALASVVLLSIPALLAAPGPAAELSDLHWRLVGPFRGGWATQVAGVPGDRAIGYFGAADGGVWKTTDAGATWKPLFNGEGSASIGALTVAPSDPQVLWVGTGQIHQRWDIADGDGVYRSTDGGATWTHVGLRDSRHIGAIWVDPRDARVAIVAALGHVFGPNAERGLFRTEDGGATWAHVVDRGPDVGAVDIAGDAAHPDTLFASLWQVRRHPWLDYFQDPVGIGSAIVKSTDGGRTWQAVGSIGLPGGALGRIELAVAPGTDSRRVWAAIDASEHAGGGLYRSDDGGLSWSQVNSDESLASSYTSGVFADPRDPDVVYALGQSIRRSTDGGKTFVFFKGSPGGDDYHHIWIDPTDPRHLLTGADQGAVVTLNGGESWSSWYNQPTGQFYRLGVDNRFPYWVYSGQQDSGTVGIASRSDYGQITFRDWHPVGGDERDGDVPDPANPDIVYGAGLGGRLSKWNAETGQVQNVSPWPIGSYGIRPGTSRYRYDWITPLAISPRPPHAIYQGAQVLFRSLDGGQSWKTVSPDLSGTVAGTAGCDGDVPVERATACGWGTIFAISPSPAADGVVWVGTNNGRVQLTRDDAATWSDVTPPELEDWSRINLIDASAIDPATAYVAVDRHRADDFRPRAYRTHDFGRTWTEIGHGLPDGAWVAVVRQDPAWPTLLYAGTSRGAWVSFDDGDSWQPLQLGLPTTGVNDLAVHGDDLVAATEGRAIWILDQLAPLRDLAMHGAPSGLRLAEPGAAYRVRGNENMDTPLPPDEPRGDNPPAGAIFDYFVPAGYSGAVTLDILDSLGRPVRHFASDEPAESITARVYFTDRFLGPVARLGATPGHHRFVWNLRRERPRALAYDYSIAAVPDRETEALPAGAYVLPGSYRVRLTAGGVAVEQPFEVVMDPRVATPRAELEALVAFQDQVAVALARSADLEHTRAAADKRLRAAASSPKAKSLKGEIEAATAALGGLAPADASAKAINDALASLATDLEHVDAAPTAPQREVLTYYGDQLERLAAAWRLFDDSTLRRLNAKLAKLGL